MKIEKVLLKFGFQGNSRARSMILGLRRYHEPGLMLITSILLTNNDQCADDFIIILKPGLPLVNIKILDDVNPNCK